MGYKCVGCGRISGDRHNWIYDGGRCHQPIMTICDDCNDKPKLPEKVCPNCGRYKSLGVWKFASGVRKRIIDLKVVMDKVDSTQLCPKCRRASQS